MSKSVEIRSQRMLLPILSATGVRLMVLLLVTLSCLNCARASEEGRDVEFHCCSPAQWTARVRTESTNIIDGVLKHNETWMTLHYDSHNQRMAYTEVSEDGQPPVYQRTMEDYKNHSWTTVVDKDLCVVYNLTGSFVPKCTPDDSSLVLFAVAPQLQPLQGVFANTAYFRGPQVTGQTTVTVGDCALVEEVTYDFSDQNRTFVGNVQYFNQTPDVDESVFTIPDNCIYVPPDQDVDHSSRHRLRSFH